MPSLQSETLLKATRKIINPEVHPSWSISSWIKYWFWFPMGWSCTLAMCILGWFLALYGWIKTNRMVKEQIDKDQQFDKINSDEKSQDNNNDDNLDDNNSQSISIIIPTFNESANIESCLCYIDMHCVQKDDVDIIIVDGGSIDDTISKINKLKKTLSIPIKVIQHEGSGGRGVCINVAVKFAHGNILIFLHGDTIVSKGFDEVARRECRDPQLVVGAFKFTVDRSIMTRPIIGLGTMELFARIRNNMFWLPYGDQGYYIRKTMYDKIGGFPDYVIMEDLEFTNKARKYALLNNKRIHIDNMKAYCSPRRWEKNGVAVNTLWNQIVVFCYNYLHYKPEKIYELYYGQPIKVKL